MSISGKIVSEMLAGYTWKTPYFWGSTQKSLEARVCMEFSKHNWATYNLRDNLPRNAHFWQVGLLDIVLSEYPDKSNDVRNFIFMTSHFSTLLGYKTTWRRGEGGGGNKVHYGPVKIMNSLCCPSFAVRGKRRKKNFGEPSDPIGNLGRGKWGGA